MGHEPREIVLLSLSSDPCGCKPVGPRARSRHPHFKASIAATGMVPVDPIMSDCLTVARVCLESMETTLFIANLFLDHYSLAKISDILNQIIPTAYVYNCGYWPFYKNSHFQSTCICSLFGLKCKHKRNPTHFINLQLESDDVHGCFPGTEHNTDKLFPVDLSVNVLPVITDFLRGFNVKMDMIVKPMHILHDKFFVSENRNYIVSYENRYLFVPSYIPLLYTNIIFDPHPITLNVYASYFENSDRFHLFVATFCGKDKPSLTGTIVPTDFPKMTIVSTNSSHLNPVFQNGVCKFVITGSCNAWMNPNGSATITNRGTSFMHATATSKHFLKGNGMNPETIFKKPPGSKNYNSVESNNSGGNSNQNAIRTNRREKKKTEELKFSSTGKKVKINSDPKLEVSTSPKRSEASSPTKRSEVNSPTKASESTSEESVKSVEKEEETDDELLPDFNFLGDEYDRAFPSLPPRDDDGDEKEEPSSPSLMNAWFPQADEEDRWWIAVKKE